MLISKKLGGQRVSFSPSPLDRRRAAALHGTAKEGRAQAVNTSSMVYNAHRSKGAALTASNFNPHASNDDGAMVLNRDEAKELFKVMAKHFG